ncbi:CYTH domain-containing protein [Streptomyces sp. NPDC058401]|uniref:CYTH domain-containing protein n=1 Tax=Streptomyces sp. NPDC058401 TaxID=3346480 RepID=UPI00365C7288
MPDEIERKYLICPDAPLYVPPGTPILQGYLAVGADHREARLRRQGSRHTLTAKSGSGLVRKEWETELTPEQFDALWPATATARLSKLRHTVTVPGARAVLDIYRGRHHGLRVAEVEFEDLAAAEAFRPPVWFGQEVTGRPELANQYLALASPTQISALAGLG